MESILWKSQKKAANTFLKKSKFKEDAMDYKDAGVNIDEGDRKSVV